MTRSRRLRPLLLAALLALTVGACSVGVGTAPEDYVPPEGAQDDDGGGDPSTADLNPLVDGLDVPLAELGDAIGTRNLKALQLAAYDDSVYLEAQDPDDPTVVEVWNWDAGEGVTGSGPKDVSGVDLESQLFRVSQVDLDAVPGLVADAPGPTGVQGDVTSSVTIQKPPGSPVLVTVFVTTPRGQNGAVIAGADGSVLTTS
ncbi:MAG TPA: hypothetical protein PKA98_03120 [Acidimicrobiales bacterium]|nr:hypothetical protein [Acidimicrobiales bacterium]